VSTKLAKVIKNLEYILSQLDVALSTRASESTLSGIKSQTDKLTFDANNRLAIQNPPNLDVLLSSRASESTLSDIKSQTDKLTFDANNRLAIQNPPNLDVALSSLSRLIRFGLDAEPSWIHADEVTAPAAGSSLVSVSVSAGKTGYIYGFYIMASEPNDFKIQWTSSGSLYSIRITFSGPGTVHYSDFIPLNKGQPADGGSTISVVNVNAGSEGKVYQARLLYLEV